MKEKMTIGLFIDSFFPMIDGVCMVVDNYAKRLLQYANVIVFAPEVSGKKFDDSGFPYKVVRCKSLKTPIIDYSMPIPKMDRKFMKKLESYSLDIVHIHSPFMLGEIGVRYAKLHHIPVIGTMHSQFKQDFRRAVKSEKIATLFNHQIVKVFNHCDECWAVNQEVARIFYEDYHYKTMPKVMNNATEMLPVKNKQVARDYINEKYGISEQEKVFLFVGRINNLKNVFFIVDSLKQLKEMKPSFAFKMLFVGSGQDEDKLKEVIEKDEMQNEVIMCGKVSERDILANYYERADLFLFPSFYDASSIVQIEAASQKTPTLFLEGAATTATITENQNGFLSKYDTKEYAQNIIKIMENQELYQQVSENCFKELYKNWDDTIKEVYEEYTKLVQKAK